MGKSKLQIPKVCNYCGKVFLAKTVKTMFCSSHCAKIAYEEKRKCERKLCVQTKLLNEVKSKGANYITIKQAIQIFTTTRSTIRRMIVTNRIEYRKLSPRKTFVSVQSLEAFFPVRLKPLVVGKKKHSLIFDMAPEYLPNQRQVKIVDAMAEQHRIVDTFVMTVMANE